VALQVSISGGSASWLALTMLLQPMRILQRTLAGRRLRYGLGDA
jgi:hypothetical protein